MSLVVGNRWSSPRATGSSFFGHKTRFVGIMGRRRLGLFDGFADKGVVAVREVVSALIAIERRRDGADIYSFSCTSVVPVIVSG